MQIKAAAAVLLPELYENLVKGQTDRLEKVDVGLAALTELPFLIDDDDDVDPLEEEQEDEENDDDWLAEEGGAE